ncbi:unnamed protein product [Amoebophrya sp. A25]|nr:unnamed protein product [Amoebophrya sp. A25]|eukprot:GSA25T00024638001.1
MVAETTTSSTQLPAPLLSGRYVLGGSGSDLFSEPRCCAEVIRMIPPKEKGQKIQILYLGTAAYDAPQSMIRQTEYFRDAGAVVSEIRCSVGADLDSIRWITPAETEGEQPTVVGADGEGGASSSSVDRIKRFVEEEADAVLISGGNTLYAVDRLSGLGIHRWIQRAGERGAVLCGGSAGAVCWFENGHSDSADPDSFYAKFAEIEAMKLEVLEKTGEACDESTVRQRYQALREREQLDNMTLIEGGQKELASQKPGLSTLFEDAAAKPQGPSWDYIRIPGLGFLPGLCVPHHDKVQSNGSLRADHVNGMLTLLAEYGSTQRAICIDHWAVLVIENGQYRVLSFEDKPGSVIITSKTREFKPLKMDPCKVEVLDKETGEMRVTGLLNFDSSCEDSARKLSAALENLRLSDDQGPDRETALGQQEEIAYVKDRSGRPGVWIKEAVPASADHSNGVENRNTSTTTTTIEMRLAPWVGAVEELFVLGRSTGDSPAAAAALQRVRDQNPAFGQECILEQARASLRSSQQTQDATLTSA